MACQSAQLAVSRYRQSIADAQLLPSLLPGAGGDAFTPVRPASEAANDSCDSFGIRLCRVPPALR